MNAKFLTSWLAAFVVWMGLSFAVHGAWLAPNYAALGSLYRPEADQMGYLPYMLGAHVLMAAGFVWIYQRGISAAEWMGQGIRYGLAMGLVATPMYLVYYAVQPMPRRLVAMQIVGDGVTLVVVGIVTAFLNKSSAKA
ncbi:MAG: hypothetical protein NTX19_07530 [Gemmatimonadetes bacterium]|nr:hypothetical protein [Gemmatimonadota bacterium]